MTLEQTLSDYYNKGLFYQGDARKWIGIVAHFLQQTTYSNKHICAFNMPLTKGALNLYFLKEHIIGPFAPLKGNCAYVRYEGQDLILCDVAFLTDWRNAFPRPDSDFSMQYEDFEYVRNPELTEPEVKDLFTKIKDQLESTYSGMLDNFFLQWVLGHEVGHAVLGHSPGRLLYKPDGSVQGNALSREMEHEADLFAINHIFDDGGTPAMVWFSLGQLASSWFYHETGRSALQLVFEAGEDTFVEVVQTASTHPPFVVRILDMLNTLLEVYPDIDNTGYYPKLRNKVRIVKQVEDESRPW